MDVGRLSNRELIARLVDAGPDDPGWLEFLSRFERRVRLTVYRTYRIEAQHHAGSDVDPSGEIARDLTQDVFLRLLEARRRALARFKGRSENSVYTYLNTIAVNLVRDHFKKLRAQKTPPAPDSLDRPVRSTDGSPQAQKIVDLVASENPGPEQTASGRELHERIAAVIRRSGFPKRDRLVFRFYFLEGRTIDEVASCRSVGLSPSGVEKCIRRLRVAVQKEIAEQAARPVREESS